jgi:chemotaxis protein methyltransferase CheR
MTAGFAGLAALIRRETGILLGPSRETALRAAVARAAPGLGPEEFLAAAADPVQRGELIGRLVDEVTIQETSFVRDRDQLDAIAWHELAATALAEGRRVVRVWSAGCATGEEAYTLALLAAEVFTTAVPPVEVLGTDISAAALRAAAAARYRPRAVRGLGAILLQRYFRPQPDGAYQVAARLRELVRFRQHNLARDPFPPPGESQFDLVVCRNVLIYFAPRLAAQVIGSFERSLRPRGRLLLGAADALQRVSRLPAPAPGPQPQPGAAQLPPPGTPRGSRRPPRAELRPAARPPARSRAQRLAAALAAADHGDPGLAARLTATLLAEDPLDPEAHFVRGLVALGAGEPQRAVTELRRALYADATFALAAFTLGRAYDELHDGPAAQRAYRQALGLLDPEDNRYELLLQQVDIGDIAAACRARLGGWS